MPPASRSSALEREIDALYAQPSGDFVAARNALAARLKKEGAAGESARVKALTRPSISAWALNQVYWHERAAYDRLLAAGDALRAVQEGLLAGRAGDLREAMRVRQEAARTVVDHAMRVLREAGNAATDATRQRVAVTVDAVAAYGSSQGEARHGRLDRDLDPPGLEALSFLSGLAAAVPAQGAPPRTSAGKAAAPARSLRLVQGGAASRAQPAREDSEARAREKAEQKARDAQERDAREREVTAAERALARAVAAEREAAAAEHGLVRDVESLRRQLSTAEDRLARASAALDDARRAREDAERALAAASGRRETLDAE